MVFSSITFLFYFLPIVLITYYITPNKFKNIILLLFSLFFYFFGEPKYVVLMITSIISTYVFGMLIDKFKKHKKILLPIFLAITIGTLIYFKYTNFLIENINLWLKNKIDFINVILPIGISFYTFQMISYIIDVYRGEVKVQKNILNLALYVSLFPQLIAGPIVRYSSIEEQLQNRTHTFEKFAVGVRKFIIGLGKKVLIANCLGELNSIFLRGNDISVLFFWIYAISVMLQIYFDFSVYSDMAIGLGKMFGFEFNENFNYPYIAKSITDFWRRWHMSLSSWFKDYVYIPLGGNRTSKIKWIRNILIVWFLTGLWHGAAWNFIMWGMYFGVILIIEKLISSKISINNKIIKSIFSRVYVLITVMISFVIFNTEELSQIKQNICGLFGFGNFTLVSKQSLYYLSSYAGILIIAMIASTPICKNFCNKFLSENSNFKNNKAIVITKIINIVEPIYLLLILVLSTSYIIDGSFNPFLYFRF